MDGIYLLQRPAQMHSHLLAGREEFSMPPTVSNAEIFLPSSEEHSVDTRTVPDDHGMVANAVALFGDEAATAVAYCGIDAWFEGRDAELRRWSGIFQKLAG